MKIVLAVDDSAYSEAAVKALITQFRPEGVEVKVFHAVEWLRQLPQSFMFGEGPTFDMDIQARRQRSIETAEQLVGRVAQQLQAAGFQTSTATPDTDPRHGIIDCAAEWKADLIVMGSHGRKGIDRLLLGSVAEAVMRHASCSVELVRLPPSPAPAPEVS